MLGSRSIRVLDLEPQTDPRQLFGTLRTACLSESPEFTALSYVWGTGISETNQITINGRQKSITQNCYNALAALCARHDALTIWVDSICINQQDNAEKNDQIQLMEDIYSWAQVVYIWLGDSTPQSDAAIDCLGLVPTSFQCLRLTDWAASPTLSARLRAAWHASTQSAWYSFRTIWSGLQQQPGGKLQSLLERPMLRRLRTAQEIHVCIQSRRFRRPAYPQLGETRLDISRGPSLMQTGHCLRQQVSLMGQFHPWCRVFALCRRMLCRKPS